MEKCIYSPHTGEPFKADALLECPFCGGIPQLNFIGNDYTKTREVNIRCSNCRVTMPNKGRRFNSEQLAKITIDNWNKRQI